MRIIIENKLIFKLRDLIVYSIRIYEDQGVKIENEKAKQEINYFFKERMRNILKQKNIKIDIIEASISSHAGDNFLDLYKKTILMNKNINKDIGKMQLNHIKEQLIFWIKKTKIILGRPDAVLFRKDEEKQLYEKINE